MSPDGDSTADNAQLLTQPCSIKPVLVSPNKSAVKNESAMSAEDKSEPQMRNAAAHSGHGNEWENGGDRAEDATNAAGSKVPDKRVSVKEENNEVIEVPSRGHHRSMRRSPPKSGDKPGGPAEAQLNAMGDLVTEKLDEEEYREEMRRFGETPDGERIAKGDGDEESEPDESGLPEESPEHVTDDDIFSERDFEAIEKVFPAEDDPFWEVDDVADIEDEEAAPRKVLRDPGEPPLQEWEEHRVDHIPYRSWCPYCVRGRGTGTPHRRRDDVPKVPIFGFD